MLEKALKLNIKTIILDFGQIELTLPEALVSQLIQQEAEDKVQTSLACSELEQPLLDEDQMKYIEQNQPVLNIGDKYTQVKLIKAYKAPKGQDELNNIKEYYPSSDKAFSDIIMEFQYETALEDGQVNTIILKKLCVENQE